MPATDPEIRPAPSVGRRWFLGAAGAVALVALADPVLAAIPERRLALRNMNTEERIDIVYWRSGRYEPRALVALDHLLRDWRRDEVKHIDPLLYDIMAAAAMRLGKQPQFRVVSGYRSPQTNEMLRRAGRGAAKNSLHMVGRAIDLSLEGAKLSELRQAAIQLGAGGVGYYPRSGFVHLDTGDVRTWRG